MAATKALPATEIAAGVKTPGSGAYSDPATVGAMIQQMYPQYKNFDSTMLGQRWIDVHTPQATAGAGATTDTLTAPGGANTSTLDANGNPTSVNTPNTQSAPDPSSFQTLVQPTTAQAIASLPATNTNTYVNPSNTASAGLAPVKPKPQPTAIKPLDPNAPILNPNAPQNKAIMQMRPQF